MRRFIMFAVIAGAAFGGIQSASATCLGTVVCTAVGDNCNGIANVCPSSPSCSGTVNVCPGATSCSGGVNICDVRGTAGPTGR